jgi:hypothetical protein
MKPAGATFRASTLPWFTVSKRHEKVLSPLRNVTVSPHTKSMDFVLRTSTTLVACSAVLGTPKCERPLGKVSGWEASAAVALSKAAAEKVASTKDLTRDMAISVVGRRALTVRAWNCFNMELNVEIGALQEPATKMTNRSSSRARLLIQRALRPGPSGLLPRRSRFKSWGTGEKTRLPDRSHGATQRGLVLVNPMDVALVRSGLGDSRVFTLSEPAHDPASGHRLLLGALPTQELERFFQGLQLPNPGADVLDVSIEDAVHAVAALRRSICDQQERAYLRECHVQAAAPPDETKALNVVCAIRSVIRFGARRLGKQSLPFVKPDGFDGRTTCRADLVELGRPGLMRLH